MMCSMTYQGARRALPALVVCAIIAICLIVGMAPERAYAKFNDVTDSYPASQDVPISGSPLTGADIPEGAYGITVSCSSYMCKFTNVTLTSSGGGLWATFTMSKAYNALFLGTAEEAAASTNEDGTDYSAYYVSEPLEGYVERQFSLPIPAVNQEITLATYSGGSKGIDGGMWYTHTVVFNASEAVMQAIEDASKPAKDDPGTSEGGKTDSSGSTSPSVEEPSTNTSTTDDASTTTTSDDSSKTSKKKSSSQTSTSSNSTTTTSTTSSSGTNTGTSSTAGNATSTSTTTPNTAKSESKDDSDKEESASAVSQVPTSTANVKRGRAITVVGPEVIPLTDLPGQNQAFGQGNSEKDNSAMVAAIVCVCVLNLILIGTFVLGLRRARPRRFTADD